MRRVAQLAVGPACVALALLCLATPATAAGFGFLPGSEGFGVAPTLEGGGPATQAGSHPFEITTTVGLRTEEGPPAPGGPYPAGDLKDLQIEEPPGLIEDPAAVPRCTLAEFDHPRSSPFEASRSGESCPDATQVGVVAIRSNFEGGATRYFGVFNLAPPPGAPSELGFSPFGVPIVLSPQVRQAGGEYGLTLELRDLSQRFGLLGMKLTIWGVPWALVHDPERGDCLNEVDPEDPWGKCSVGRPAFNPPEAYLSLPPSCTGPLSTVAAADSWQDPGTRLPDGEANLADPAWAVARSTGASGLQGCNSLAFEPEVNGRLTTARAASPTGYALEFAVRDQGLTTPTLTQPSPLRKAVVTLPEGMTLNPSVAAGLGVCTPAQYAAETASSPPGAGCPNASKIGRFTVKSPLLEVPLEGAVFLAKPLENPFGSLLGLYIVAKAPAQGLIVKVAGDVQADPQSGRLTATFDQLPQLPYSSFDVLFREGQRSPLLTPASCGRFSTQAELHPWLDPEVSLAEESPFGITEGIEGSACPGGVAPPFAPAVKGGMLNSQAGAYTPFYLRLSRQDTEQEITSYSATLPPGLLGDIAGIPYCPEADIAAAARETGVGEEQHPSCPAASEIGHTYSGYGVGTVLAYAPGRLYLAGPYHGSAFSVVAIDSATVGPFDLGTIVVRSAIEVDPHDAQVSIDSRTSDPIPHIIDGIPLHLRDIRIYLDRPGMMLNPTSCDPFALTSSLTGSAAPFTDPRDIEANPSAHFQASNCESLGFEPGISLRLRGGTHRGSYERLTATVTPRPGDADIAAAAVTLPPSIFLAQNHLRDLCARPQLEAEACPPGSVYGEATALTPLLAEPMRGAVYLVPNKAGAGLPELVTVLHGQGLRILVEGRIDKGPHGGIRGTFEGLPDAPVTRFTMTIFGGRKHGILQAADENLCSGPQIATARFLAQDNTGEALHPRLAVQCGRGQGGHRRDRHSRGGKRR